MNLFVLWRQKCSVCSSWSRPSSLSWDSRGEYISPAPHFLLCAGLSFPVGCTLAARGGEPSLRRVHIRCAAHTALFCRAAMLFHFTYPVLYRIIVDRWTFPPTRFPGDAVDLKRRFMAVSYSRATRIEVDYVSYTDTIIIPQTAGIVKSIPRKNPIIYRPAPSYPARRFSLKYGAGPPHCPLRNSGVTFCLQTP